MGRALWGEGGLSLHSPAKFHKIVNPTGLVEGLALANEDDYKAVSFRGPPRNLGSLKVSC